MVRKPRAALASPKRIRVAFVITGLHAGGSEVQLTQLVRELHARKKEFEVLVISLISGGVHAESLLSEKIPLQQFSVKTPLLWVRQVRAALKEFKPDVVHAWLWHATMVSRFACRGLAVPLISAMRGQEPTRARKLAERALRFQIMHYTANSQYIANYYGLSPSDVTIIPNGWPSTVWKKRYGVRKMKHAVAVSRLVPEKDLTSMIKAMAIATDWHLSIVSTGPREQELRDLVSALKLTNVEFLGYRTDVPSLIARASCLIHLAFEESAPNAVIEALLLGTPVIASDIPALRELVGERGVLVPNGSPESVAKALQAIPKKPSAATVKTAQKWAQARFDLDTMVDAHAALYRRYAQPQ